MRVEGGREWSTGEGRGWGPTLEGVEMLVRDYAQKSIFTNSDENCSKSRMSPQYYDLNVYAADGDSTIGSCFCVNRLCESDPAVKSPSTA